MSSLPRFTVSVLQGPMTIQNKRVAKYDVYVIDKDVFKRTVPLNYDFSNLTRDSVLALCDELEENYITVLGPFTDIDIRLRDSGGDVTLWTSYGSVVLIEAP